MFFPISSSEVHCEKSIRLSKADPDQGNTSEPIFFNDDGNIMDVNLSQAEKVSSSISVIV